MLVDKDTRAHFQARLRDAGLLQNSRNAHIFYTQAARAHSQSEDRGVLSGVFTKDAARKVLLAPDGNTLLNTPPSDEEVSQRRSFSDEAKQKLEATGAHVYRLTTRSLDEMNNSGFEVSKGDNLRTYYDDPYLMYIEARGSEVAVMPAVNYSPRNLPFAQRQEACADMRSKIIKGLNIDGIDVVIGEAADYALLARLHQEATGKTLVEEDAAILTSTMVVGVTRRDLMDGISVRQTQPNKGVQIETAQWVKASRMALIPLIVPSTR